MIELPLGAERFILPCERKGWRGTPDGEIVLAPLDGGGWAYCVNVSQPSGGFGYWLWRDSASRTPWHKVDSRAAALAAAITEIRASRFGAVDRFVAWLESLNPVQLSLF